MVINYLLRILIRKNCGSVCKHGFLLVWTWGEDCCFEGRRHASHFSLISIYVILVSHRFSFCTITQMVINTSGLQSFPEIELENTMLSSVVSQEGLLVLSFERAFCVWAGVWSAVREYFVNSLLEMLHDQMVLLLPVLVLGFGLEPTEFTCVGCSESIGIFG